MTVQAYLIVENNVVTNNVMWDGDTQTWTPPADSIQLVTATTPAMIWLGQTLTEVMGSGAIGFTWDGTVLTTNEPQPVPPTNLVQPQTTGTQTA